MDEYIWRKITNAIYDKTFPVEDDEDGNGIQQPLIRSAGPNSRNGNGVKKKVVIQNDLKQKQLTTGSTGKVENQKGRDDHGRRKTQRCSPHEVQQQVKNPRSKFKLPMKNGSTTITRAPVRLERENSWDESISSEGSEEESSHTNYNNHATDVNLGSRSKLNSTTGNCSRRCLHSQMKESKEFTRLKEMLVLHSLAIQKQRDMLKKLSHRLNSQPSKRSHGKTPLASTGTGNDGGSGPIGENNLVKNAGEKIITSTTDEGVLENKLSQLEEKVDKLLDNLPNQIDNQCRALLQTCEPPPQVSSDKDTGNSSTSATLPKWKLQPSIKPRSNTCSKHRLKLKQDRCTITSEGTQNVGPSNENNERDFMEKKLEEVEKVVENLKQCCFVLLIKFAKMKE